MTIVDVLSKNGFFFLRDLEATSAWSAIQKKVFPLECYVSLARAVATVHGTLENEARQQKADGTPVPALPLQLAADFERFRTDLIPEIRDADWTALSLAQQIRIASIDDQTAFSFFTSFLDGLFEFALFARSKVLSLTVAESGLEANSAFDETPACSFFPDSLFAQCEENRHCNRFCQSILELMRALSPEKRADVSYSSRVFNPEAGSHPVPCTAAELEASLCAATLWEEGYGKFSPSQKRSSNYTRSDGAWLVTLAALEEVDIVTQIMWLDQTLSRVGLNCQEMARYMKILHDELAWAVPERKADWEKLLRVSQRVWPL